MSSTSKAARAKGDSGWFSAKLGARSTVSRTVRPNSSGCSSFSTTPEVSSASQIASAWSRCRCRAVPSSSLPSSSFCIAAKASAGRASTFSTIEWVTAKLEVSGSGGEVLRRSKVDLLQETEPSGGFFRTIRFFFFSSSPARASSRAFSTS